VSPPPSVGTNRHRPPGDRGPPNTGQEMAAMSGGCRLV
jgi:hypothetical protein